MTLLDKKFGIDIGEKLKEQLVPGTDIKILTKKFSLYAFVSLLKELQNTSECKVIIPNMAIESFLQEFFLNPSERAFRNTLSIPLAVKLFKEWYSKKCLIKKTNFDIEQNIIIISSPEKKKIAVMGGSPFTSDGLGFTASSNPFVMNNFIDDNNEASELELLFNNWSELSINDEKFLTDFDFALTLAFSDKSPQMIYYDFLFNIFNNMIAELNEENIINSKTGIKETLVWNKLYKFQKDGVLGAIEKIERHNGCIIADSVGLGKTFEALAIIKYYELRNDRVLVLCPKKLRENWTIFTINDKRNLFADDRFNYDVLNHTDLSRVSGTSGEINLETLNWGNYDLVVIDESHNFRNNPSKKDGGETRYSRLMNSIIRSGVKTKVLMLSATPVNNRMNDLKNQIAFITEGKSDALKEDGITSIENTLRIAQTRFNQWLKLPVSERTTEALVESLNFDYFKLLDLLTIARSRKHIEKYYDITEIGNFPNRRPPINIKAYIDIEKSFPDLKDINNEIKKLNLSSYAPLKYVFDNKRLEYSRKYDQELEGGSIFSQLDREQSLIHLMRVNILKRMESSINSFMMTLKKVHSTIETIISKIDKFEPTEEIEELSIEDIEAEDEAFTPFVVGRKVKVLLNDMDTVRWKEDLEDDKKLLEELIASAEEIDANRDRKLKLLKDIIRKKLEEPINEGNKKIIVFTAFSDTASYLYDNISEWVKSEFNLHTGLVTGGSGCKTTMPGIKRKMMPIITSFSPISKERNKIYPELEDEIDILIATDCISEGQNLQDCDFLINYDIHWNPVRIVQRFGRIDRLGSINKEIQLVNFWPNMDLDQYINLEARVSGRMVLLDISATGEENVIDFTSADQMNDLEYRKKQLEKLQSGDFDIESGGGAIAITDLTFNDFRMSLNEYLLDNERELTLMPPSVFSVVNVEDLPELNLPSGVIFCLKNETGSVIADPNYPLNPFYLVYVKDDGSIFCEASNIKKTFDILKAVSTISNLDENAIAKFNRKTNNSRKMEHYRKLLSSAVQHLVGTAKESKAESLFSPGGINSGNLSCKGLNDFEVVSYIVLI